MSSGRCRPLPQCSPGGGSGDTGGNGVQAPLEFGTLAALRGMRAEGHCGVRSPCTGHLSEQRAWETPSLSTGACSACPGQPRPPEAAFRGGVFGGCLGVTQRRASEALLPKKGIVVSVPRVAVATRPSCCVSWEPEPGLCSGLCCSSQRPAEAFPPASLALREPEWARKWPHLRLCLITTLSQQPLECPRILIKARY